MFLESNNVFPIWEKRMIQFCQAVLKLMDRIIILLADYLSTVLNIFLYFKKNYWFTLIEVETSLPFNRILT